LRVLARASWRLSSIRSLSGTILRRCREGVLKFQLSDIVGRLGHSPEPVEVPVATRTRKD
jgi:hypothetical protein